MQSNSGVIQVDLGAIGASTSSPFLLERSNLHVVGAVDVDPRVVGRDLGEVAELPGRVGVKVAGSVGEALAETAASAALLTTVSGLAQANPQIDELLQHKLNVISSCEELSFPWQTQPKLGAEWTAPRKPLVSRCSAPA